jgi:hypothetical protein
MYAITSPSFMAVLRAQRAKDTWAGMMAGKPSDWLEFFRMIEDGTAHGMIRENSKTYTPRSIFSSAP